VGSVSSQIVGRDAELAEVDRFLDDVRAGPVALALEGAAGIGKTTLWHEGAVRAEARSYRLLACRAASTEAKLSFVALGDLVERGLEDTLTKLPSPQRHALEVALLRAEAGAAPPDQRAIATAFLGALRMLSAVQPVVVAIDDLQWLDAPTREVLDFAARRLRAERVGVFTTIRTEDPSCGASRTLVPALPEVGVVRVQLGPLSLGALHRLLRTKTSLSLTRPTLLRLMEVSRGNPFFALEIARVLERAPAGSSGPTLPVPNSLRQLLSERLARLSASEREPMVVAAALSEPTFEVIGRVVGRRLEAADLERAERLEIVEVAGDRMRFTHPLIGSVLYAETPEHQRRSVHRRIADAVANPEERARHLALAAAAPDAEVAAELDHATSAAAARGALAAAADLAGLACDLTPPQRTADMQGRQLLFGEYLFRIGDAHRAREVLERALEAGLNGATRARALLLLGRIAYTSRSFGAAVDLCERALLHAGADRLLCAEIHAALSWFCDYDAPRKGVHARAAVALLEQEETPSPRLVAAALRALAEAEFFLGRGIAKDIATRAIELERASPPSRVAERTERWLAVALRIVDDLDGSRRLLEELYQTALEEGDDSSLSHVRMHLALAEADAGNLRVAQKDAREALELAEMTGQEIDRAWALTVLADVDAQLGDEERARTNVAEVLAFAERVDDVFLVGIQHSILGSLELARGDPAGAEPHFAFTYALTERMGIQEPGLIPYLPDYIETLVELDDIAAAERLTRWLEERASTLGRPRALADSARCRGLLLAAAGDLVAANAACGCALVEHDRLPVPYELARTLLVLGEIQRRRKERGLARTTLERALAIFDGLGARLWSERTRAELGRVGGRRPGGGELTPTEERVAELAASGLTNREVAAAAFVSAKTVEANLARVYRKLGIRSRAQLGSKMAERRSMRDSHREAHPVRSSSSKQ
jgi:ATP/maltotriose-dependent transcriptional regulator MalT